MNKKNNQRKKNTKWIIMLLICIITAITGFTQSVYAKEFPYEERNEIMTASQKLEAREEPSQTAEIIIEYEEGAPVFVIGLTADGWYVVSYQDKIGYVKQEELQPMEIDAAAWEAEFTALGEESSLMIEEVERVRQEQKRSRIWGTVIVILVFVIFTTGIIGTIRANKNKIEEKQ